MAPIATYVFLDLETTGLPEEELNKTKITEISMIAVKRCHVTDTRPGAAPRVQHKLTLCLNPRKLIQPSCTDVTGLSNELLEYETDFNINVCTMINTFLEVLTKPLCVIAHNGYCFDFPILKKHFEKLCVSLSEDVMVADTLYAFYNILEGTQNNVTDKQGPTVTDSVSNTYTIRNNKEKQITSHEATKTLIASNDAIDNYFADISEFKSAQRSLKSSVSVTDILKNAENDSMQLRKENEMTPKRSTHPNLHTPSKQKVSTSRKVRRKFLWSEGARPRDSYKLKDIYERVMKRPPIETHRAENDCILLLELSVALSEHFVQWIDCNHTPFSDVKAMTIGVPLGQ